MNTKNTALLRLKTSKQSYNIAIFAILIGSKKLEISRDSEE